jgi:transposase InsO family protein
MSPFENDFTFLDRSFSQPINGINSGHPIYASGRGTMQCTSGGASFTAPKSLFVPDLPFRLFSSTRALLKGAETQLFMPRADGHCGMLCIPHCPPIKLYFVDNLIVFTGTFGSQSRAPRAAAYSSPPTETPPPSAIPFFDSLPQAALLHHLRNNHRGTEIDKNTLKVTDGGPSLPARQGKTPIDKCDACINAKSHHKSVPHSRRSKASRPHSRRLVYTDWFGPVAVPGRSGERWVQAFIDDESNFVGAYVCRSKAQGASNLRAFQTALSELTHGACSVTVVQADYERVFTDGTFAAECATQQIQQRFSAPYSHAQNGRIERWWRTMEIQVSAMLSYSQLPPSFWPYAVRSFVHTYNRQSDSLGSDTPYECLTLQRPSIGHFRVWGCPVLVHLEKHQHAKFAAKCIPAYNLGPNLTTKDGYYVYVPSHKTIRTSRHLDFDEFARARSQYYTAAMTKPLVPQTSFTEDSATRAAPSPIHSATLPPQASPPPDAPSAPDSLTIVTATTPAPLATPQNTPRPADVRSQPRLPPDLGSAPAPRPIVEEQRGPPPAARRALGTVLEDVADAPADTHLTEFDDINISDDDDLHRSPSPSPAPARRTRAPRPPIEWWKVDSTRQSSPSDAHPGSNSFYTTIAPLTALFSHFAFPTTPASSTPLTITHASTPPFALYSTLLHFSPTSEAYCFANVVLPTGATPRTHDEALSSVDKRHWRFALDSEYEQLVDAETWELVPRSEAPNVISGKWVFKIKKNSDGSIDRYKARWVARGFSQKHDIDYTEIFAPVIRYSSVRLLLSIANIHDLDLYGCDVSNAFARSDVDQNLYVRQPTGYEQSGPTGGSLVCKLIKGLYGTKQAARLWHRKLRSHLLDDGWGQFESDPGIYYRDHHTFGRQYLGVYVDDLLHACSSPEAQTAFLAFCNLHFPTTSQGPLTWILGMEVKRDRKMKILSINQTQAITTFLETNGVTTAPFTSSPMEAGWSYGDSPPTSDPILIQKYRSQVASINFYSQCTRPDLAFPVSALSRHLAAPNEACFRALARVLNYLHTTSSLGIVYHPSDDTTLQLEVYADASFGNESINNARSPQGYLVYFAGGLIDWKSNLQSTVALSTAEAEHLSAFSASRAVVYYRQLLEEFNHAQRDPTVLWEDNEACIAQSKNPVNHKRNLHMLVKYHYLRDLTESNVVRLQYIRTTSQLADVLTKPLPPLIFTSILPHLVRPT